MAKGYEIRANFVPALWLQNKPDVTLNNASGQFVFGISQSVSQSVDEFANNQAADN